MVQNQGNQFHISALSMALVRGHFTNRKQVFWYGNPQAKQLKDLEKELVQFKKIIAEQTLQITVPTDYCS